MYCLFKITVILFWISLNWTSVNSSFCHSLIWFKFTLINWIWADSSILHLTQPCCHTCDFEKKVWDFRFVVDENKTFIQSFIRDGDVSHFHAELRFIHFGSVLVLRWHWNRSAYIKPVDEIFFFIIFNSLYVQAFYRSAVFRRTSECNAVTQNSRDVLHCIAITYTNTQQQKNSDFRSIPVDTDYYSWL